MSDINTLRAALFETLRAALFETLQGLKSGKIDIEKARAINETAQTIINSAKVEVDYMKVSGATVDNGFITALPAVKKGQSDITGMMTGTGVKQIHALPGATVTQHRMR